MKEIFFHYSEFKGDLETLQPGDDVEFTIKDRNVRWTPVKTEDKILDSCLFIQIHLKKRGGGRGDAGFMGKWSYCFITSLGVFDWLCAFRVKKLQQM